MSLSRQEIIDFALQYLAPNEVIDFPIPGDLFGLFQRELPANKILKDDEGWRFAGYNLCRDYILDNESKPAGKWIWLRFVSLSAYPPFENLLKLQPPHIVKGIFQNPERTFEYRIAKVALDKIASAKGDETRPDQHSMPQQNELTLPSNILQFPLEKARKRKPRNGNNDDGAA